MLSGKVTLKKVIERFLHKAQFYTVYIKFKVYNLT